MVYGLKLDIKREKLLDQAEKLETQYRKALSSNNVNYDQAGRLLKANEAHQELWHKYQTEILQSSEMQALQKLDSGTVDTNEYQTGPAEESFKSLMQNMLNPQTTVNGTPTSAQTTNRYDQNDPRFVRMGGVPMVDSWQSMNYGSGTSTTAITPRYGTNGYPSWNSPNYSGPGSTWGTSPLQGGYGYPASTSGYIDPNGIPYYGSNQYGGYNGSSMTSPRQNYTWGQQPYQSGNRTSDYGNGYTTPTVFNGGYGGTSPYYGNYGTTTAYRSSPYYGSNTNLGGTSGALGLGVGPGYMYSGNGLYGNSTILSGSTGLGTNGSFAPTPNRNRGF
jgi:hypothetical protein